MEVNVWPFHNGWGLWSQYSTKWQSGLLKDWCRPGGSAPAIAGGRWALGCGSRLSQLSLGEWGPCCWAHAKPPSANQGWALPSAFTPLSQSSLRAECWCNSGGPLLVQWICDLCSCVYWVLDVCPLHRWIIAGPTQTCAWVGLVGPSL